MLHQWADGSDAAAIAKLGEMFTAAGGTWEQTAVAGHTANTLAKLRADVIAGNAPAAVQLKGPEIAEWNATGKTANLDELAAAEGWDAVVAPELLPVMKPEGAWVAAPMNIHRINWLWGSTKAMAEGRRHRAAEDLGGVQRRLRQGGGGGQDLHRAHERRLDRRHHLREHRLRPGHRPLPQAAFVEGDPEALRSEGMVKALRAVPPDGHEVHGPGDRRARLRHHADHARQRRRLFFIMGDWPIGTLTAGGLQARATATMSAPQAPTDWGKPGFILNSDSVVFFQQSDPDYIEGQKLLASLILSPEFQTIFNQAKGSIPARLDVDLSQGFNPCQQLAQADLKASIEAGTLVRSMAHNMTVLQKYRGAMMEIITEFVNSDMSPEDAANAMADEVEAQM